MMIINLKDGYLAMKSSTSVQNVLKMIIHTVLMLRRRLKCRNVVIRIVRMISCVLMIIKTWCAVSYQILLLRRKSKLLDLVEKKKWNMNFLWYWRKRFVQTSHNVVISTPIYTRLKILSKFSKRLKLKILFKALKINVHFLWSLQEIWIKKTTLICNSKTLTQIKFQ